MSNWQKEFRKWLPDHRVVYVGGGKEEREEQLKTEVQVRHFDATLLTWTLPYLLRRPNPAPYT